MTQNSFKPTGIEFLNLFSVISFELLLGPILMISQSVSGGWYLPETAVASGMVSLPPARIWAPAAAVGGGTPVPLSS